MHPLVIVLLALALVGQPSPVSIGPVAPKTCTEAQVVTCASGPVSIGPVKPHHPHRPR